MLPIHHPCTPQTLPICRTRGTPSPLAVEGLAGILRMPRVYLGQPFDGSGRSSPAFVGCPHVSSHLRLSRHAPPSLVCPLPRPHAYCRTWRIPNPGPSFCAGHPRLSVDPVRQFEPSAPLPKRGRCTRHDHAHVVADAEELALLLSIPRRRAHPYYPTGDGRHAPLEPEASRVTPHPWWARQEAEAGAAGWVAKCEDHHLPSGEPKVS